MKTYEIALFDDFWPNHPEKNDPPSKFESDSLESAVEMFCQKNYSGLTMDYGSMGEFDIYSKEENSEEWKQSTVEIAVVAEFILI